MNRRYERAETYGNSLDLVGIGRLTFEILRDILTLATFVRLFRRWWRRVNPSTKYRLVQLPIEAGTFASLFGIGAIGLYFPPFYVQPFNVPAPIVSMILALLDIVVTFPLKGKFLTQLRRKWRVQR